MVRCGPKASRRRRTGGGPSDPLVGGLPDGKGTDQGLDGPWVPTRDDGSRTSLRTVVEVVLGLPEGRLGDETRAIQFLSCATLRRSGYLESGGDEETRTPDPLLAKEMLCQLSYVPVFQEEWWAFLDSNQRPLPYQGSALTS